MPSNASADVGRPGMPSLEQSRSPRSLRFSGYATRAHRQMAPRVQSRNDAAGAGLRQLVRPRRRLHRQLLSISFTGAAPTITTSFVTAMVEIQLPGRFFGDLMVEEANAFSRAESTPAVLPVFRHQCASTIPCRATPVGSRIMRSSSIREVCTQRFSERWTSGSAGFSTRSTRLGLRDRTIVIVQSDHGHSTEERAFWGGGKPPAFTAALPKFSLFEGAYGYPRS